MDILTTRVLSYADEEGHETDLVLTIFVPHEVDGSWRCGFTFSPALQGKYVEFVGVDFLQALLICLGIVPQYLRLAPLPHRAHWQGIHHCGLPSHAVRPADHQPPEIGPMEPNPGHLDILATRMLCFLDQYGATYAIVLKVYKPFQTDDGKWRCAFSLCSDEGDKNPVRYGTGADFIESLLDALTLARATCEATAPTGWQASNFKDLLDCADFPYKIGRAFFTEPAKQTFPNMPDFSPSWLRDGT